MSVTITVSFYFECHSCKRSIHCYDLEWVDGKRLCPECRAVAK